MKKPAVFFITGFLCWVAASVTDAATVDPPHYDPASGYTCARCHTSHMDLGATGQKVYNNVCLNCHRLSDPKAGTKPFTPADAADPFNIHSSVQPQKRFQHSHRWDGSDTNPAAGALPPVYPTMTTHNLRGRTDGELACVRCHNQHDNSTNKPFLRMANNQDQMCLDCHRPRDVQDQHKGSHPVRVNYLTAAARPDSNLKNPADNNNPANTTSDLNYRLALSGGQLLCTTCHGVHYTDSRSSTVDGAANFLNLSSSDGNILRTDLRGQAVARGTADNLNICTNCHTGKMNHNYKQPVGQDVQCADCHAAHVDVGDGSTPNSFLVRRYMNISTPYGAVRRQPVLSMATSALSTVFVNGSGRGTGVCQACHVVPVGPNYPAQHNTTSATARDCIACHKHDGQFGSFSGGCTACHGFPPSTATTGGPSGKAAGYTGNESLSKHLRHAGGGSDYSFSCDQCHKGNNHIDGNFQDVFRAPTGTLADFGMRPTYNPGTSTCASVYCHSNGNGVAAPTPPAWFGVTLDCSGCHGANAASGTPIATGRHGAHMNNAPLLGTNYGCAECHGKTVTNDATIGNKSLHVNGLKDYSGARASGSASYSTASGACSATYCHTDGKGTQKDMTATGWKSGATLDCTGCHGSDAAPAFASQAGEPNYANAGAGLARANSHRKHVSTAGATTCVNCHSATTSTGTSIIGNHTNRVIDVVQGNSNTFSFTAASKSCSNISCHFGGTAQWGGSLGCTGCHGGNAASGSPIATNRHAAHVNNSAVVGKLVGCAECHAATVSGDTTIFLPANHANSNVNVKFDNVVNLNSDSPTYNGASTTGPNGAAKGVNTSVGSCANVYCHSNGNTNGGATPSFVAVAWDGASIGCDGCHGDQTGKAHPVYANGGVGTPTANSHVKHVETSLLSCDFCHLGTTTGSTIPPTTVVNGGTHLNRTEDVNFKGVGGKTGTFDPAARTCSSTYCHGNAPSPAWGGATNCSSCHGASNAGTLSGTIGANPSGHALHYNSAALATAITGPDAHSATAYVFSCGNCHTSNLHAKGPSNAPNRDADIGGTKLAAGNYTQGATSTTDSRGFNYTNGSCITVCHTRDGVSGAPIVTPAWNEARTANNCGVCHNKAGDAAPVWSPPHTKHINIYSVGGNANISCNSCHSGTASDNSTINGAAGRSQHPNQARDVAFNAFAGGSWSGTQCQNTYCHSNGTTALAPSHGPISWNGVLGCASCHSGGTVTGPSYANGAPKANSHARHVVTMGYGCNTCHGPTTANGTTITDVSKHLDKKYEIAAGTAGVSFDPVTVDLAAYTVATCTNISCHGGNNATWGGTASCENCHLAASDKDDFRSNFWVNYTTSTVSSTEWTTTGHGRSSGTYASGNPAASFSGANQCLYCHDPSINHRLASNPFRLRNYSTIEFGRNAPCLICHAPSGSTVLGKGATKRVASTHNGYAHDQETGGGQFCWDCHDPHGDANAYMIHTNVAKRSDRSTAAPTAQVPVAFTAFATGSDFAGAGTKLCNACHTAGNVDYYTSTGSNTSHNIGSVCTACHNHDGADLNTAFRPSGECNACHGYPPVRRALANGVQFGIQGMYSAARYEDYSGGGGAHTISFHVKPTAKPSETWSNCAVCHGNGSQNPAAHVMQMPLKQHINHVTIDVQDQNKFDYRRTLGQERYTGARLITPGNRTGSCSNVNCHFKPSKRWSIDK